MTGLSVGLTIESVNSVVVEPSMSASYEQVSLYVCVPLLCLSSLKTIVTKKIKAFLSSKGIIVQP